MSFINVNTFNISQYISENENKNDFFEVDELIAPVIQVLNRKGYLTKYCCSGHPYKYYNDENEELTIGSYILFQPNVILPSYPPHSDLLIDNFTENKSFEFSIRSDIRVTIKEENYYSLYNKIIKIMKQWLGWAISLPNYSDLNPVFSLKKIFLENKENYINYEKALPDNRID